MVEDPLIKKKIASYTMNKFQQEVDAAVDALLLQQVASEQLGFAVPEPSSVMLVLAALAGLGWATRRSRPC